MSRTAQSATCRRLSFTDARERLPLITGNKLGRHQDVETLAAVQIQAPTSPLTCPTGLSTVVAAREDAVLGGTADGVQVPDRIRRLIRIVPTSTTLSGSVLVGSRRRMPKSINICVGMRDPCPRDTECRRRHRGRDDLYPSPRADLFSSQQGQSPPCLKSRTTSR